MLYIINTIPYNNNENCESSEAADQFADIKLNSNDIPPINSSMDGDVHIHPYNPVQDLSYKDVQLLF